MPLQVPQSALEFGFRNDPIGTYGSRTMMLKELRMLLDASIALKTQQPDADGSVSLVVPDDDHLGSAAVVVVTEGGSLRTQKLTTVGGASHGTERPRPHRSRSLRRVHCG